MDIENIEDFEVGIQYDWNVLFDDWNVDNDGDIWKHKPLWFLRRHRDSRYYIQVKDCGGMEDVLGQILGNITRGEFNGVVSVEKRKEPCIHIRTNSKKFDFMCRLDKDMELSFFEYVTNRHKQLMDEATNKARSEMYSKGVMKVTEVSAIPKKEGH